MKLAMARRWIIALGMTWAATSPAQSVPNDPFVSIAFVGDILLDDTPGKVIKQGRDPFRSFAQLLNTADIRIGNLECVAATTGKADPAKPFSFRAHPRVLPVLRRHFDAVALANNHSGDFGVDAFAQMLSLLKESGIKYFGGGLNLAEAHKPLIFHKHGLKIALLGYNEFFPRSFEADYDQPGIAWSEDEQVQLDIVQARSVSHADLVIPVMHWGLEHEPYASERQQQLARLMIDAGADAVVGGHPHVTQNIEIYKGRPIIYSLGNFLFDGFKDEDNNTGWFLRLELDRAGIRRSEIHTAHIDKEGIPHPRGTSPATCWTRGQVSPSNCMKQAF